MGSPSWHLLTVFHYCLAGENILLPWESHKTTRTKFLKAFRTRRGSCGHLQATRRLTLWQEYKAGRVLLGCPPHLRCTLLQPLYLHPSACLWQTAPHKCPCPKVVGPLDASRTNFGGNGHFELSVHIWLDQNSFCHSERALDLDP